MAFLRLSRTRWADSSDRPEPQMAHLGMLFFAPVKMVKYPTAAERREWMGMGPMGLMGLMGHSLIPY